MNPADIAIDTSGTTVIVGTNLVEVIDSVDYWLNLIDDKAISLANFTYVTNATLTQTPSTNDWVLAFQESPHRIYHHAALTATPVTSLEIQIPATGYVHTLDIKLTATPGAVSFTSGGSAATITWFGPAPALADYSTGLRIVAVPVGNGSSHAFNLTQQGAA